MSKQGSVTNTNWRELLPPIFAAVCVQEGQLVGRYRLDRPFVLGDYVYATDGRIGVRMPTPTGLDIDESQQGPAAQDLRWLAADREVRYRVPAKLDLLPRSPCKKCGGNHRCEECDGSGESECGECGQDCECAQCDGAGKCMYCDEDGLAPQAYRVFVPRGQSVGISEEYARIVSDAGAEWIAGIDGESPFRFESGRVSGLVMPRKTIREDAELLVELCQFADAPS